MYQITPPTYVFFFRVKVKKIPGLKKQKRVVGWDSMNIATYQELLLRVQKTKERKGPPFQIRLFLLKHKQRLIQQLKEERRQKLGLRDENGQEKETEPLNSNKTGRDRPYLRNLALQLPGNVQRLQYA